MILFRSHNTLGLVARTKRTIASGIMYEGLFPPAQNNDRVIKDNGDVGYTVEMCKKIVESTLDQTRRVAPLLRRSTTEETCKAVFDFFYKHYQYKEDDRGFEQLRSPARAWADRKTGIDCDCFSISISSLLSNLHVPHYFRIVKMYGRSYYQHIYVVVPKFGGADMSKRSDYIVIDPVLDKPDYEAPGINEKMDYKMGIPIQYLNGVGGHRRPDPLHSEAQEFAGLGAIMCEPSEPLTGGAAYRSFLNRSKKHLIHTRNMIARRPHLVTKWYKPQVMIGMIDQAIGAWDNEAARDNVLGYLSGIEHTALQNQQLQGLGAIDGFFSKIKKGVKKVGEGIKKGAKAVAKVAKKVAKAVIKFNPVTIAARAGFRLAMKTNFAGIAAKAYWGYFSEEEAKAKGVSSDYWQRATKLKNKIEDVFGRLLKGEVSNIKEDILKGGKKKAGGGNLKGTNGIGVVETGTITAALSFLTPIITFLKNLFGKGKGRGGAEGEGAEGEEAGADTSEELAPEGDPREGTGDDAGNEGTGEEETGGGGIFDSITGGGKGAGKNNKLLLFGGLALGAILLLKGGSNPPQPAYYPPPPPQPYPPQSPYPPPPMRGVDGVKKRKARPAKKAVKTIKLT